MKQNPFDDSTNDALLRGLAAPDDVPDGLREVTELVQAARRPASADELVGEHAMVGRIAAAVGEQPVELQGGEPQERSLVFGRFRKARVGAAAAALVLVGGTAAAAASGVLPSPVQTSVTHHAQLASSHTKSKSHSSSSTAPHGKAHIKQISGHHGLPATPPPGAFGTVTSVGGVTDAGACGTANAAGSFDLKSFKGVTLTVNVDGTTTTFVEPGVANATFANVCVGEHVGASGTVANNVVTATKVGIAPPHTEGHDEGAFGKVASVGGVSTDGTCAPSETTSFTLTSWKNTTVTVNVDSSTTYKDKDVPTPTIVNVCVGEFVVAKGTNTNNTVAATEVFIASMHPHHKPPEGAFGKVASVGGVSTDGTCAPSDTTSFTLTSWHNTVVTVNVDGSTTYTEKGVSSATIANVCVGELVAVKGTNTNNTVAATAVFIAPPHPAPKPPEGAFGKVASADGNTTDGACVGSDTGSFTLTTFKGDTITVNVASTTKYFDPGVSSPTFANVCVGEVVGVGGTVSGTTVTADKVFVAPPKPTNPGGSRGDGGHHHDGGGFGGSGFGGSGFGGSGFGRRGGGGSA